MPVGWAVSLFAWLLLAPPPTTQDSEPAQARVIYREAATVDLEVVFIQGPLRTIAQFGPFYSGNTDGDCFWLDVELHARGTKPIRLSSHHWWLGRDLQYDDFRVFDMLVVDREIIFTAGATGRVNVFSIGLPKPARVTYLTSWSMIPSLIPPPEAKLDAKLSYAIPQGRVQVEVIQSLKGVTQHTLFEQQKPDWEFARVKQWQGRHSGEEAGRHRD